MAESTGAPGNWRTPYRELLQFSRLAFAWEYLRRNQQFRDKCRNNLLKWRKLDPSGNLEIFESGAPSAAGGDCLFASSVDLDARSATVFWSPDSCPSVLRAFAIPETENLEPFTLADSSLPVTLLLSADGAQHVLIRDGVRCLQLVVHGASLLHPVGLLIDTGWSPAIVSYQDRSLKRLRSYRAGGVLQEWDYPPDPYAARLALVLQALDGWRAGARHRDIAEALYGFERVALDWADPRESLRDQVRYAISRGRALMDHGYRGFLQ